MSWMSNVSRIITSPYVNPVTIRRSRPYQRVRRLNAEALESRLLLDGGGLDAKTFSVIPPSVHSAFAEHYSAWAEHYGGFAEHYVGTSSDAEGVVAGGAEWVDNSGNVLLELHALSEVRDSELAEVAAIGAHIVNSTAGMSVPAGLGIITAWVPYDRLDAVESLDWLAAVLLPEQNAPDVGPTLSEGVALHNADDANTVGIDGTGVTVGVISDGVTNLAMAQAAGELPATVTIPAGCTPGYGDEGTAMLEIVHDMAPGAALQFCATGGGTVAHMNAQINLASAGADVITEDIAFDTEPAFQQGAVAAVGDAIAAAGISIHSSAGNRGANHVARVPAVPVLPTDLSAFIGCPSFGAGVVDIDPGAGTSFDVDIHPGSSTYTLQWSEPRAIFPTAGAGGFTDLDLHIMDSTGSICFGSSTAFQGGGLGDTIEQLLITNSGPAPVRAKLVVSYFGGSGAAAIPTIDLRWRGAVAIDPPTRAGSLNPDSNYIGLATSSAAADAGISTDPTTTSLESFSSGGPVDLFLTTDPSGSPGPPPITVGGPNWTAADGVSVSGAGPFPSTFFGTSAAAPHAAACDALTRQRFGLGGPGATAAVNAILSFFAVDRGPAGFDSEWGAGVLDCLGAADLSISKTDDTDPVLAGMEMTYTLTVDNLGPTEARKVVLTDTLPSGVTYVSDNAGCTDGPTGTLTCALGTIPSGGIASIDVVVKVDGNVPDGTTITNSATVSSPMTDPNPANNTVSQDTLVKHVIFADDDLHVTGTDGDDVIRFFRQWFGVSVQWNATPFGPFPVPNSFIAYGLDGHDSISIGPSPLSVDIPGKFYGGGGDDHLAGAAGADELDGGAGRDELNGYNGDDSLFGGGGMDTLFGFAGDDLLDGGNGDDELDGGSGNDIILGGNGMDELKGAAGFDLLIGGENVDTLRGQGDRDILIGGTTDHDSSPSALQAIMDEWTLGGSIDTRITKLTSGGGLNGPTVLTHGGTVDDDVAADQLHGNGGEDWFFEFPLDVLNDATAADRVTSS